MAWEKWVDSDAGTHTSAENSTRWPKADASHICHRGRRGSTSKSGHACMEATLST